MPFIELSICEFFHKLKGIATKLCICNIQLVKLVVKFGLCFMVEESSFLKYRQYKVYNKGSIMKSYNTIVLCLSHFNGGMELDSIKMAKGLNLNNKSTLLVCKSNSFISSLAKKNSIDYEEIRFSNKFSFSIIFGLRNKIKKYNIKNIIFLGTSEILSIYFSLINFDKINFIVRYGTTRATSKNNLIHRVLYSRVNNHLSISNHLDRNVKEIIPVSEKSKKTVIYTSTFFEEYLSIKDEKKSVHVGRITKSKGQLEAINSIVGTDLKIDFLGSIEDVIYYNKIVEFIEKNNLHSQVKFIGFCEKPQEAMSKASYFIFPSYGEGLSNALVEALGQGLICIVYNNTVFPEFLDLGFKIHLVDSEAELSSKVKEIIANYKEEMVNAANNSILAKKIFSSDREFSELANLLI